MSTSRPFAFNTGPAISGTIQIGSLAIGTPTSGTTGSPKWWNGPDEDLGYVIAKSVSGNTQPTPIVGEYASVGFYRSTGLTESSFIDLAQKISTNQTFSTGNAAYLWLTGNGYWSSWVYVDPIQSDSIYNALSSSGKTTYTAATSGNWVLVSLTDYNNVVTNVSNVTRYGTTEAAFSGANGTSWSSGFALQNPYQTPVPINNYVIGFCMFPDRASSNNILYSGFATGTSVTYTKMANSVTSVADARRCYVRKTPYDITTGNTYFAVYAQSAAMRTKGATINPTYYKSAGGTTVTPTWLTWNANIAAPALQIIATPTLSW